MIAVELTTKVPPDALQLRCKIGQGAACCRYLTAGAHGMECEKLTGFRAEIDRRVAASFRGNRR